MVLISCDFLDGLKYCKFCYYQIFSLFIRDVFIPQKNDEDVLLHINYFSLKQL